MCEVMRVEKEEIVLSPIYEFKEMGEEKGNVLGELVKVGELNNVDKLLRNGLMT